MKTNSVTGYQFRATLLAAMLLGAAGSPTHAAPAAPPSPAGTNSFTWDFVTSGAGQQGITFLTFSNDFTFSGYVLIAGTPAAPTSSGGGRNTSGSGGRGGSTGGTTSSNSVIFGFGPVSGPWGFDNNRHVIGYFSELVNVTAVATNYSPTNVLQLIDAGNGDTTNVVVRFTSAATASTNITWTSPVPYSHTFTFDNPNYVVVPTAAEITNTVSFKGTVTPGKRLTLVAVSSYGKVTFNGVPYKTTLTDLTGNWYGTKTAGGPAVTEFFTLAPSSVPNVYFMDGQGPGYSYNNGVCVLSAQKKIGFNVLEGGETLRATYGSFAVKKGIPTAATKGIIESSGSTAKFDAALQAY